MIDPALPTEPSEHGDLARKPPRLEPAGRETVDIAQLALDHHHVVYRYAFRLTGSPADAEDLTQQTFLIAHTKIHQLREVSKVRAWLFSILRSCFLKNQRRRTPIPAANVDLNVDEIGDSSIDDDAIDRQRLQDAINELSPEFRLVVVMFYFEECSYKEIAQQLAIPIGTVMSRLSRAKGHLRARLLRAEAGIGK